MMKRRMSMSTLVVAALCGCGGGTTGRLVELRTTLTTDLGADHRFTTGLGWTLTLTEAQVSTGAMYYFDGEPAFTSVRPGLFEQLIEALQPIHVAYAHPGHYVAGNAKGEQLMPFSADLLAGPAELPVGDGVSGNFRSATFSFAPPSAGPAKDVLGDQVVRVAGTASKDGRRIHFLATAALADLEKTAKDGQINGCNFAAEEVLHDGAVTITLHPRVWFNLVDFAELEPGSPERPTAFAPDSTARIAFALGLTQLSAYTFAFEETR